MKRAIVVAMLLGAVACAAPSASEATATADAALESVGDFGSNPGKLSMLRYVPQGLTKNAPAVVVLHGCTQSVDNLANQAGWNALADKLKFVVIYPQQRSANNPTTCFDWFGQFNNPANKDNITRGKGENMSIKQMVDKTKADFSIDPSRVFAVGFSAGAAMTAVLLAAWPDVFSAGAIFAGVPYDCPAQSNSEVWQCQNPGKNLSPAEWGDRARRAFPTFDGAYPRVSIWQGANDSTVSPNNASELADQWSNVHGLSSTPTSSETIAGCGSSGCKRDLYGDKVERYQISGMGHGYPVDPANGCGSTSTYVINAKICATTKVAEFFGLQEPATPPPPSDGGTEPPPNDAGPGPDPEPEPEPEPTGECFLASNYDHVQQGRARTEGGKVFANGSNAALGLYNTFTKTSLQQTEDGGYVLVSACPSR